MNTLHHDIDINPIPKDTRPIFINEPWIVDQYSLDYGIRTKEPEPEEDNIRIYVPVDINAKAIIRRLEYIINRYEEANEKNELYFSQEVQRLICQIEIYDQIWYGRHIPDDPSQRHSNEAIELVRSFVDLLEKIPDGCAEFFPFEMIDDLTEEYL